MVSAVALLFALQDPAPPPPPPRRYADQGTSHLGVALGLGTGSGGFAWLAGGEYGYFVVGGLAPGVDAQVSGGTGRPTVGLTLGTLRLLPFRSDVVSLVLIGRGGRVYLSDHPDGWGVGGGAGLIFFSGARVGFQIGYDVLRLTPSSFCADLSSCTLQGLSLGLVLGL
jgi:hypothetical protein